MTIMMTAAAASGERGVLLRPTFFRAPSLLLLGIAFVSCYGVAGGEDFVATAVRSRGNIRQGNRDVGVPHDYPSSDFRESPDGGEMESLARIPGGEDLDESSLMASFHLRLEELELTMTQGEVDRPWMIMTYVPDW